MVIEKKLVIPTVILAALVAVDYLFLLKPFTSSGSDFEETENGSAIAAQAYLVPVTETSYIPILDSAIQPPIINAKSAIVFDARSSRVLYSKNIKEKLPVASLTKILTMVVAMENFSLNDTVTVTKDQTRVDKEKQTLFEGETITVGNLIRLMLVESSNDAAYALAYHGQLKGIDFVGEMNRKAGEIGIGDSNFSDPAGLDDLAYSTAEDILKLAEYSLRYKDIWEVTTAEDITVLSVDEKIKHTAENTNELLGTIPYIIGGKTGYTDGALGCMMLMVNVPNYPSNVFSIVLGSRDRFGDTQKLLNWINEAYRWK